ncbi:kinase binding protein CGI-121-domain-containing protein [Zychaea mexicana]|uniref:kinase binding protein CGI-121-domain-containing protein n=1 Tax=Zychaea mexicana TaxID=64656 RepID=UPI0022FF2943|nr:kinase binding protein CGI-121-domain-containing protein [Zychaea mexicana]KAI9490367.1 kinase binding protein CGI-121-domain-containing protein [Zychaea mexicana]
MESHTLELYPDRGIVHVSLFRNVTNAPELRKRLIAQDTTLACALVDATVVMNVFHVLLATNRAVHDEQNNQIKSHNVHSEIVVDLSPSPNIAQAFRRFGLTDETKDLVVVKVGGETAEVEKEMRENVKGDLVPLSQLEDVRDIKKIKKYYQVGNEDDLDIIMQLVAGAMALKGHV